MNPIELLSDPMVAWYEPKELLRFKQLNHFYNASVQRHMQSETHYLIDSRYSQNRGSRARLYAAFPNIQKLTYVCDYPNELIEYLRPQIQSIHLIIPMWFTDTEDYERYTFQHQSKILSAFGDISRFLQGTPTSQLKALTMSLAPKVDVSFTYPRGTIVGYDRNGAIFEEYEITKAITDIPPTDFFYLLNEMSIDMIRTAFLAVAHLPRWKNLTVPYHFPGAQEVTKAIHTDIYEPQEDDYEFLIEYLIHLKHK